MVWDRGSEPLVVLTRWTLLVVALDGAPVWTCGAGVGFTERIVGRRLCVTYEVCMLIHIYDILYVKKILDQT